MNENEQYETELAEIALNENVPSYNEQRVNYIYNIISKNKIHRLLDVGCGLGKVTIGLKKKGIDVKGIDVSSKLILLAKKAAKKNNVDVLFEVTTLENCRDIELYDGVLFAGVLEHIEDDVNLMKEAKKFLKDNGKIIITDAMAFMFLYMPRDKRIGHVRRYTKKMLRKKLLSAGYTEIKLWYWNFLILLVTIYMKLFKKDEYSYGIINPTINKILSLWYKYLENNHIFYFGDRITAVATKKNV